METIKQDLAELLLIKEQLKSEQLEKINFDSLILQLGKVQSLYDNYQNINCEYQYLQNNLVSKITIMEKAIVAVTKKRPELKEFSLKSEELSLMDATALLKQFDKTEARFHAAFPSTFRIENNYKKQCKDYKSYK